MTGPAPAETMPMIGWFVLLGVIVLSAVILAAFGWWENHRQGPVFRAEDLPRKTASPTGGDYTYPVPTANDDAFTGMVVRELPGTVAATDGDGPGRHRRPELVG